MGQFVRRIVFSSQTLTSHTKSKCLLNRLRPLLLLRPRLRPRKFPTKRWQRQLRKLKLKPTPPRPKREQRQRLLPRRHPKRQQKRKWKKKKVQKRLQNNKESKLFSTNLYPQISPRAIPNIYFLHTCTIRIADGIS